MAVRGLHYDEPADGPGIAVDEVGSPPESFQILKAAFGVESSVALVAEARPLPARDYHGGASIIDSGRHAVAAGAPASIGVDADVWIDAVLLVNLTGAAQRVTVQDGSGASYGDQVLEPNEWRLSPLGGLKFAGGFKIGAENGASVVVQLKGTQ